MPKSTYGAGGSKSSYSGTRGNVAVGGGKKEGGSKGSDMFFKDRTMQNNEGVGKKSTIQRRQPS